MATLELLANQGESAQKKQKTKGSQQEWLQIHSSCCHSVESRLVGMGNWYEQSLALLLGTEMLARSSNKQCCILYLHLANTPAQEERWIYK